MKKSLAVLLALIMCLSLLPLSGLAEEEKLTIEFFYSPWASAPYAGVDPYEAYAEEKYGCDFILTPATDFETQLLTRANAGDLPDLICCTTTQLNRFLEQEIVLDDWTPFLEKMPTISAALTDIQKAYFTRDGKLIACPSLPGGFVTTLMVRKDWLANLNMNVPTNIDELLEVMRAFTYDDPDGNGVNDTYGFTTAGAGKHTGDCQDFLTLFDRDGNHFYIDDEGKVNHPILDGTFLEYLKLIRTMYAGGYFFPDWFTQGDEDRYVEIYNGKIGVVFQSIHHVLYKTDVARNYDGTVVDEWDVVPIEPFGGKILSRSVLGAIRTVSADTAKDPAKMDIICRYLDEGAFPNEDFFILRAGYKVDGYDVLEEIADGIYFLGKSSKDNVTVRQQGSIMFGWGQMVQAEGLRYIQSVEPSLGRADIYRAEKYAQVESYPAYDGAYQLIVSDPTTVETSSNMISEFELAFILGNKTEADWDNFVDEWTATCGNELLADAETYFTLYGLLK